MVSHCGCGCKRSRKTHFLEAERVRKGIRLWTQMQREPDNVQTGRGEEARWCHIVNKDAKGAGQRTSWRWRGSVKMSDCRHECQRSRITYSLKVERERDGVRLWTRMQREQDNVLSEVEREHDGVRLWT